MTHFPAEQPLKVGEKKPALSPVFWCSFTFTAVLTICSHSQAASSFPIFCDDENTAPASKPLGQKSKASAWSNEAADKENAFRNKEKPVAEARLVVKKPIIQVKSFVSFPSWSSVIFCIVN